MCGKSYQEKKKKELSEINYKEGTAQICMQKESPLSD